MFSNKRDLDVHVRNLLQKITSEYERKQRGYILAKHYYKINEYESAEQYLSDFLTTDTENPVAYKLLGNIYQKLKKYDKALQSFQKSLQLCPKQPEIITEVCTILLADNKYNASTINYWCNLAESENIQNDAVFSLRLKASESNPCNENNKIESLMLKEITNHPDDPNHKIRLVKHYTQQEKIEEAFKFCRNNLIESLKVYSNAQDWFNVVYSVLLKYEQNSNCNKDWDYYLALIVSIERQVYLSFQSSIIDGELVEISNWLFLLDQNLYQVKLLNEKINVDKEMLSLFLSHYEGMLCLYSASLIFERSIRKRKNKWRNELLNAIPLLLVAFQKNSSDLSANWIKYTNEKNKKIIQFWKLEGSFRCCQAGRTILSTINTTVESDYVILNSDVSLFESNNDLIDSVRKYCSDNTWTSKLFSNIFCNANQKLKFNTSAIGQHLLSSFKYDLPTVLEIENFEETAEFYRSESLHHMVYLSLGKVQNLASIRCTFFNGLKYSIKNLSYCGVETLSQLDIETFLLAAVVQAQRKLEIELKNSSSIGVQNQDIPMILPYVNISKYLGTEEQADWWFSVYRIYKNLIENDLPDIRTKVQAGLETVRGINGPKCDLIIILRLGKIFVDRLEYLHGKPNETLCVEARAECLFKLGLNMYKLHKKNVLEPFRKVFRYLGSNETSNERAINILADDAINFISERYLKNKQFDECIELLTGINLPFATYFLSKAYRQLDEINGTPRKLQRPFADKARECLNKTIGLLKDSDFDKNHPLNSIVGDDIKSIQFSFKISDQNDSASIKNIDHSSISLYEDAEEGDFNSPRYTDKSNWSRKTENIPQSVKNVDFENMCKQIGDIFQFMKDEFSSVKTELSVVKDDVISIKEKICTLDDNIKSLKLKEKQKSSDVSDTDIASNVLDDLYITDEDLKNQIYANSTNIFGTYTQLMQDNIPRLSMIPQNPINPQTALATNYYQNQFLQHIPNPTLLPFPQRGILTYPDNNTGVQATIQQHLENRPTNMYGYGRQPPLLGNGGAVTTQPPSSTPFASYPQSSMVQPVMPQTVLPQSVMVQHNIPQPNLSQANIPQPNMSQTNIPQCILPQQTSTPIFNKALNNKPVEKTPPVNVVITSSDPLPISNKVSPAVSMSVTIPIQHIKQQSTFGGFQGIGTVPFTTTNSATNSVVTSLEKSAEGDSNNTIIPTFNMESKFTFQMPKAESKPVENDKKMFSNLNQQTPFSFQMPKSDEKDTSNNKSTDVNNLTLGSNCEDDEYDPRPDFKPIIDLPDEVEVKTGEENEDALFSQRAKLYRHMDNEWKERGVGILKILKNLDSKYRLLMRRDQVHKICANHFINSGIQLTVPKDESRGFIWIANDFSEEKISKEKFFVRFKNEDIAKEFQNVFLKCSKDDTNVLKDAMAVPAIKAIDTGSIQQEDKEKKEDMQKAASSIFSFNFKTTTPVNQLTPSDKPSPFSTFSFSMTPSSEAGKVTSNLFSTTTQSTPKSVTLNTSGNTEEPTEEYVPTAEFKPVIPLPDLVDVVTGEENEKILYSHRAKLLRYDKASNEWKERGIGDIKVLQNNNNPQKIRLVMRREVIHKLCCNQLLQKNTTFTYHNNTKKALMWVGQDFSENELAIETLTLRFKTDMICSEFLDAVKKAQQFLNEKHDDEGDETDSDSEIFIESSEDTSISITKEDNSPVPATFGDKFKPKIGSWTCKACYIQNDKNIANCVACNTPQEENVKTVEASKINADSHATSTVSGFGDKFKPKLGSWNCNSCYLSNIHNDVYCKACDAPKDDTVPKKPPTSITFETQKNTFSFGFKSTEKSENVQEQPKPDIFSSPKPFSFGFKSSNEGTNSVNQNLNVSFGIPLATSITKTESETNIGTLNTSKPIFNFNIAKPKSAESFNLQGNKEFSFTLAPKSPGKNTVLDVSAEDDNSICEEEENNTYFTPVIPLPEKVDVKTGEEDENVLYCQRAKLYRFTDGEWKERGLGDFKILQHRFNKKLRCVMRREQVLKICLNHVLNEGVQYKRKDEKSWEFAVVDYSEGEMETNVFSIRFKNKEISEDFITAVQKSLESNTTLAAIPDNANEVVAIHDNPLPLYQPKLTKTKNIFKPSIIASFEKFNDSVKEADSVFTFRIGANADEPTKNIANINESDTVKSTFSFHNIKHNTEDENSAIKPFAMASKTSNVSSSPIFGSSSKPVFGQTTPIFGNSTLLNTNIFGQTAGVVQNSKTTSSFSFLQDKKSDTGLFSSSGQDFATLASAAKDTDLKIANSSAKGEFVGLTNNDAFRSFERAKENNLNISNSENNTSTDVTNDDGYDPHYEPIIQLPPEIVRTTGEEEEIKIFGERAKLYRFDEDNKEWKERGVGEMKILKHQKKDTYRFLLRREQIHKLVLNHSITTDIQLSEFNNNPQAFVWAAMNFADGEHLEKLAVRFKNVDIATRFKKEVDAAVHNLKGHN